MGKHPTTGTLPLPSHNTANRKRKKLGNKTSKWLIFANPLTINPR
jgi:hypothetical protein